ncbi:hypothetical protein NQ314_010687 [Rhamnusium bicolor]|uniref:Uncharacterized protein n=1 Tax=Rhamnusium bicolor TaxID=1586634 RepID=A0AAV8XR74_9CUCU|nr:hypothetical protein NQ314_010687 [Rhamnusium bicolor]
MSPEIDSCSVCDRFNVAIKEARANNDDAKLKLTTDHRKAKAGQEAIGSATKEAIGNQGTFVITFDLQRALPTPKLSTGPTFYKKKLFCYNFNIHSTYPTQGYFYIWDESIAGRGAVEIESCLLKHFEMNNIEGTKLIAISDNCIGQNKNWTLMAVWLRFFASGYLKKIVHIFPQVGHTVLPSDRNFVLLENYVRAHCQFMYDPNGREVLKKSQKKTPCKQPTTTNASFDIRDAVMMEFSSDDLSTLHATYTYDGLMLPVSLRKRGRPTSFGTPFLEELPLKYDSPLAIENSELQHVLSCLQWIPSVYHPFYNNLIPEEN